MKIEMAQPSPKENERWLFHYRLPDAEFENLYLKQIAEYTKNEEFFGKQGFTLSIAEKLLPIAMLTVWDLFHLFSYSKDIPNGGTYLEIGSAAGGSLLCAFLATQLSGFSVSFIAIDLFQYGGADIRKEGNVETQFLRNTRGIPNLKLLKSTSDMARDKLSDRSVDLLFFDGDHHYEFVKRDIENYFPKLKGNGVLLGHDYTTSFVPGVRKAADEVLGKTLSILPNSCIFMARKET